MNKWTALTSEEMQIKTTLNLYPTQVRKAPRCGEDVGKEEPVLAGMETVTPTPTGHMWVRTEVECHRTQLYHWVNIYLNIYLP